MTRCLLIGLLLSFAWPAQAEKRPRTENLFMCPCEGCTGKFLPNCGKKSCAPAQKLRHYLDELEKSGKTDAEIRELVIERYDSAIVANPDTTEDWWAYALPFISLLIGGGLIVMLGRRWVARGALLETRPTAADEISDAEQQRIEAAMRELE